MQLDLTSANDMQSISFNYLDLKSFQEIWNRAKPMISKFVPSCRMIEFTVKLDRLLKFGNSNLGMYNLNTEDYYSKLICTLITKMAAADQLQLDLFEQIMIQRNLAKMINFTPPAASGASADLNDDLPF